MVEIGGDNTEETLSSGDYYKLPKSKNQDITGV